MAKVPSKKEDGTFFHLFLSLIKLLVVWKKSTRFAKIDQDVKDVKDSNSMLRKNKGRSCHFEFRPSALGINLLLVGVSF